MTDHPDLVFTSSGSAAILHALRAIGVGPGDQVLLPTYHCPSMVAPAVHLGARPIFYPITPAATPDLAYLGRQSLARVRAMLVVHYFGLPVDLREVKQFCVARGISLIEDCAHAFFGAHNDHAVGTTGDAVIASCTKFFPVSDCGCLILRNGLAPRTPPANPGWRAELKAVWDTVELGSRYRRVSALGPPLRGLMSLRHLADRRRRRASTIPSSAPGRPGSPADLLIDEQTAARAATRWTRFIVARANRGRIIEQRRRNYQLICRSLHSVAGATVLFPRLPDQAVPYVCPVHITSAEGSYPILRTLGVPVMRWDRVWPDTPMIPGDAGRRWSRDVIQLCCHQDMTEEDIRLVAQTLIDVLGEVQP